MAKHPVPAVLRACSIYLERDYASEQKDEKYLLGIIRREVSLAANGNGARAQQPDPYAGFPHLWDCAKCGDAHETPACPKEEV
jgi:hypothetical protein